MRLPVFCDRTFCFSFALAVSLLGIAPAGATPSVLNENEKVYDVSLSYTSATLFWDRDRNLQDITCHAESAAYSHRLEYGYSQYSTWFGVLGLVKTNCDDGGDSGLDDVNLGLRYRIGRTETSSSALTVTGTIPSDNDQLERGGQSRRSCGAYGLSTELERQDQFGKVMSLNYSGGVQFYESPLLHQFVLRTSLSGLLTERWAFTLGLAGSGPLSQDDEPGNPFLFRSATVATCGTQAKVLSGSVGLSRLLSKASDVSCGLSTTLRGESVTKSHGVLCGYTTRWK